ncbi:major facilitator-type transporter ecdD [Physcia stellaris]|nr:major facilitator-type transporter ecdD [Physcia stellaris]
METAMIKLDNAYINIEEQIKKGSSPYKHSRQLIDSLLEGLNDVIPEIIVRHTSESSWFGKHIKQPLPHTDVDVHVEFPSTFSPLLDQFSGIIRHRLQAVESKPRKSADQPIISKKRILSMARLYRIASSLPFMLKFWSNPANIQRQMTSADMKKWLGRELEEIRAQLKSAAAENGRTGQWELSWNAVGRLCMFSGCKKRKSTPAELAITQSQLPKPDCISIGASPSLSLLA